MITISQFPWSGHDFQALNYEMRDDQPILVEDPFPGEEVILAISIKSIKTGLSSGRRIEPRVNFELDTDELETLDTMKTLKTAKLVYVFYNAEHCIDHELNKRIKELAAKLGIPNKALSRTGNFEYLKYEDKEWFWPAYTPEESSKSPK
ncbi:MAG TPA: hypothetical protein PKD64_19690 [Pirellulaceae bacterium]|nr:hypothetical protein [Pirellulaceae bacterium]HMO94414.1 hypothetical protein [Pirellulaceae bacterium]HMP71560.1 hypothetical protein [Pirellulaceae bacterium]